MDFLVTLLGGVGNILIIFFDVIGASSIFSMYSGPNGDVNTLGFLTNVEVSVAGYVNECVIVVLV